jgi:hypothetical protein
MHVSQVICHFFSSLSLLFSSSPYIPSHADTTNCYSVLSYPQCIFNVLADCEQRATLKLISFSWHTHFGTWWAENRRRRRSEKTNYLGIPGILIMMTDYWVHTPASCQSKTTRGRLTHTHISVVLVFVFVVKALFCRKYSSRQN